MYCYTLTTVVIVWKAVLTMLFEAFNSISWPGVSRKVKADHRSKLSAPAQTSVSSWQLNTLRPVKPRMIAIKQALTYLCMFTDAFLAWYERDWEKIKSAWAREIHQFSFWGVQRHIWKVFQFARLAISQGRDSKERWLVQTEATGNCSRKQSRWKRMQNHQLKNYEQNVCKEEQLASKDFQGWCNW